MIGLIGRIEVEVHLEVEKVGGRKSQVGGRKVLTGGGQVLTGGRRIQREAQQTLRRSIGRGREARQAIVKRSQAIRLSQKTVDLAVMRGVIIGTGHHVRRTMRCFSCGKL